MVGGSTKNNLWPHIISDILGKRILVPEEKGDLAVRGAAILAGFGSGVFSSIKEGYKKIGSPFYPIKSCARDKDYYSYKFNKYISKNIS